MGLVTTALTVEIPFAIAPRRGRLAIPSLKPFADDEAFGQKLFIDAHASISVPSTLKCSVDSRRVILGARALGKKIVHYVARE